jgi:hypothetical protein
VAEKLSDALHLKRKGGRCAPGVARVVPTRPARLLRPAGCGSASQTSYARGVVRCEGEVRLLSGATWQLALPLLRLLRKPTEPYGDENHDHRHDDGVEALRHEVPGLGQVGGEEFLYRRVLRQDSHQPEGRSYQLHQLVQHLAAHGFPFPLVDGGIITLYRSSTQPPSAHGAQLMLVGQIRGCGSEKEGIRDSPLDHVLPYLPFFAGFAVGLLYGPILRVGLKELLDGTGAPPYYDL